MTDAVRVRDCSCPGQPHEEGDEVYLRPSLDLSGGLAAESALLEAARIYPLPDGAPKVLVEKVVGERTTFLRPKWFEIFLRHGAYGWNLVGEDGTPVPFDIEALIGDYSMARLAAEAANDRYSESVLAPFQSPPPKHSRNGRTAGGTRRTSPPTPLRSKRSSPPGSGDGASLTA